MPAIPSRSKVFFLPAASKAKKGRCSTSFMKGGRIFSSAVPPQESEIEPQIRPRHGPSVCIPDALVRWAGESAFDVQFKAEAGHQSNRLAQVFSGGTA